MKWIKKWGLPIAGFCAGAVNGLFGAGGGMVLVPLLTGLTELQDRQVFPCSVCIILPVCLISLVLSNGQGVSFSVLLPYLVGSAVGGLLCGFFAQKLPTAWLHRFLGLVILWGGVRYLC